MCGKWESFPREFAKCRRCRKAKYCGKECQSTAWSEGHRFWCSAKDPEEDGDHHNGDGTRARANTLNASTSTANGPAAGPAPPATGTPATGRAERRVERTESDNRQRRAVAAAQILAMGGPGNAVRTAASPIGNVTMNPNTAPTNLAPTPNGNPVILPGPSVGNGPVTWQWPASILNMRRPRGRTDDVNAANLPGEPSDPMRVVVDQQPAGAPRPLPARRMAVLGEPRRPGMPPWGREEIVEDGDEDDSMIIG